MEHPHWIVKYGYRNRNPKIVRWSDHSEIAKVSSDTDAKLIAAAPELLEALKGEAEYYEVFAEYGTATEEVREGHRKRARDLRQIIYNIEN